MFRAARADECEWLSELAFSIQGGLGLPPDVMQLCRSELTISADSLVDGVVEVMDVDGESSASIRIERVSVE
jgi:hypothetical protein